MRYNIVNVKMTAEEAETMTSSFVSLQNLFYLLLLFAQILLLTLLLIIIHCPHRSWAQLLAVDA